MTRARPFRAVGPRSRERKGFRMAPLGRKPHNNFSVRRAFAAALLIAVISAALAGATSAAPVPRSASASAASGPIATADAKCVALIKNKKGKYVALYEKVYKYKFVKVKKSATKFQRKIVKVRQK